MTTQPDPSITQVSRRDPYGMKLSEEQRKELTALLCDEIRFGLQARDRIMSDNGLIDYAYAQYEQEKEGRTGADLTSPIVCENVDAMAARAVKTIFTEPLWIAEGVGESARKAPAVEEYLQWRQEGARLQKTAKRTFTAAFIEEGAVLEVCEDAEPITRCEVTKAAILTNDVDGSRIVDEKGRPQAQRNPDGSPIQAAPGDDYVEVRREYTDYRRRGASFRLHSMKDTLFLPGHARSDDELYGQAFRFWRRLDQIKADAAEGRYGYTEDVIEKLGTAQERDTRRDNERANVDVQVVPGSDHEEKELWRVQILANLNGDGFCFYKVTLSVLHECLLSIQQDWLPRFRGVYFNPFPRTYSVYGYSMALVKLGTVQDEHTAWRNMNADRATLKANAPMKIRSGSQYHPDIQPFGPGQFIFLNDLNELEPMEFEDVPQGALNREAQCVTDAQRIIGMNDIAIGQVSAKSRTLGENELATRESFTRTDDPIGNLQEAMEEIGELMHLIEVKTLQEMEDGIDAPAAIAENLRYKGKDYETFDGTFTADMIDGIFRFKPRGSVESADPNKRQQVLVNSLGVLAQWAQLNPHIAARMQAPQFADALMQMWVTEFKPRDKQPFLTPVQPMPPPGMPGQPGMEGEMPPEAGGPTFGGAEILAQVTAALPQMGGMQ